MAAVTFDQVREAIAADNYAGFCTACGEQHDNCEPDARDRKCESCGEFKVCGAEEILVRGEYQDDEPPEAAKTAIVARSGIPADRLIVATVPAPPVKPPKPPRAMTAQRLAKQSVGRITPGVVACLVHMTGFLTDCRCAVRVSDKTRDTFKPTPEDLDGISSGFVNTLRGFLEDVETIGTVDIDRSAVRVVNIGTDRKPEYRHEVTVRSVGEQLSADFVRILTCERLAVSPIVSWHWGRQAHRTKTGRVARWDNRNDRIYGRSEQGEIIAVLMLLVDQ